MWEFCPLCGGKLSNNTSDMYVTCSQCGQHFYKNSRPTVGVYIFNNNKLLLIKRGIEPSKGLWDTPGGFVQVDEHPKQAAEREVAEELGVKPNNLKLLGVVGPDPYKYQRTTQLNLELAYTATIPTDTDIKPADDAVDFGWFDLDNLPELAFKMNEMGISLLKESL